MPNQQWRVQHQPTSPVHQYHRNFNHYIGLFRFLTFRLIRAHDPVGRVRQAIKETECTAISLGHVQLTTVAVIHLHFVMIIQVFQ